MSLTSRLEVFFVKQDQILGYDARVFFSNEARDNTLNRQTNLTYLHMLFFLHFTPKHLCLLIPVFASWVGYYEVYLYFSRYIYINQFKPI